MIKPAALPKTGAEVFHLAINRGECGNSECETCEYYFGRGHDASHALITAFDAMIGVTADAGAVKALIAAINSLWDDYWDNRVHEQLARFTVYE